MKYKCCMNCYDELVFEDITSAHLWPQICGYACTSNGYLRFRLDNDVEHELYVLEDMGFVVTNETDREIQIRVEGYMIDAELEYAFCIDIENHVR